MNSPNVAKQQQGFSFLGICVQNHVAKKRKERNTEAFLVVVGETMKWKISQFHFMEGKNA